MKVVGGLRTALILAKNFFDSVQGELRGAEIG